MAAGRIWADPDTDTHNEMNLFLLLPVSTAIVWLLHAYLRLSGRRQYRLTLAILLAGPLLLAIISLYVPSMLSPDPDPSRAETLAEGLNRRGFVPMLFVLEAAVLCLLVGLAEFILRASYLRRVQSETGESVDDGS
jgi:hypothetical protein